MDIESETGRIQQFVADGNYHAAINIALSALNECRRNEAQACVDEFLRLIERIVQTLVHEFGSEGYAAGSAAACCCLCGVTADSAELLSGATGAICGTCAEKASRHFAVKDG